MSETQKPNFIPLDSIKTINTRITSVNTAGVDRGLYAVYLAPNHPLNTAPTGYHEIQVSRDSLDIPSIIEDLQFYVFPDAETTNLVSLISARLSKLDTGEEKMDEEKFKSATIRHEKQHQMQEIRFRAASLFHTALTLETQNPKVLLPNEGTVLKKSKNKLRALMELQGKIAGIVNARNPADFCKDKLFMEAVGGIGLLAGRSLAKNDASLTLTSMRKQQTESSNEYETLALFCMEPDILEKAIDGSVSPQDVTTEVYSNLKLALNDPTGFVAKMIEIDLITRVDQKLMAVALNTRKLIEELVDSHQIDTNSLLIYQNL